MWKAATIAVYDQKNFVYQHANYCGMVALCQQIMENILECMKAHQRACGNGLWDYLYQISSHFDLYCLGQVFAEQVDFRAVAKAENTRKTWRICDSTTDAEEDKILQTCPVLFRQLVTILGGIHANDPIPPVISRMMNSCPAEYFDKYSKISKIVQQPSNLQGEDRDEETDDDASNE